MNGMMRRLAMGLLVAHGLALVFGLIGLLVMLPHPHMWASDPRAVRVFDFSMRHAGAIQILLGAAAMAAYGIRTLGARLTVTFLVATYSLSLTSELIGTKTGWPFGEYAYTNFLGAKIAGRVPFTIPCSWFSMGLASYILGSHLAARLGLQRRTLWSLLLGAWLLTAWDLVLDPAMAHPNLHVQFWRWGQQGAPAEFSRLVPHRLGLHGSQPGSLAARHQAGGNAGLVPPGVLRLEYGVCDDRQRGGWPVGAGGPCGPGRRAAGRALPSWPAPPGSASPPVGARCLMRPGTRSILPARPSSAGRFDSP